tara:strand:- start:5076 stop:6200 length:1125 start_codon:yes stop_codon:yes gene_type:complete
MKTIIIGLAAFSLVTGIAQAQDDPLPDSVARAYLAYEQAVEAGDTATATETARSAWQAARDERIDAGLIGILAENYATLAQAAGENDEAYAAWRNAAEISDRLEAPESERATGWYNAGVAAFANGALLDANTALIRSARHQGDVSSGADLELLGMTHYLIAASSARLGQLRGLGEHAGAAIAAFQTSDRAFDSIYADAYYLLGISDYARARFEESVADFNMARGVLTAAGLEGREGDIDVFSSWILLAQSNLNSAQQTRSDAQLAASQFPPEVDETIQTPQGENNQDAGQLRRAAPRYPREAEQRGREGVVLVRFGVDAQGRTEDIEIVAAIPTGIFEAASVEAVRRWHYQPAVSDGQAVPRRGIETAFVFKMR